MGNTYWPIAVLMLKNLFGINLGEPKPAPTLERLILLWNQIEELFVMAFKRKGLNPRVPFNLNDMKASGLLDEKDTVALTHLRKIRTMQVHSTTIDRKQIEQGVNIAEELLAKLRSRNA